MAEIKKLQPWYLKVVDFLFFDIYYTIKRTVIDPIRYFPREVKWFIQRGTRGWADCDTWGLDDYLARIIYEGIKHLNKNSHGYPCDLKSLKDWRYILSTIEYTFKLIHTNTLGITHTYLPYKQMSFNDYTTVYKKFKSIGKLLTKKEFERYQLGWSYYREYFFALWD